ncbi:MAG: substrate-binding periplasmic protein [Fidelibacterota bacterium]
MKKLILIMVLLLLLWYNQCLNADTLTAGISDWPPWQMLDSEQCYPGIMTDIFREATARAGIDLTLLHMPNIRRNELCWGKSVDAELGVSPGWRPKYADVSVYTIPVFETVNVVVAKKGQFSKTDSLSTFYGSTIGTNLGYFYADGFIAAFEKGLIRREDTSKEGPLIMYKLINERVDAVILDKYEALYWIKKLELERENFEFVYEFKTITDLRIRLHKSKSPLLPELNEKLTEMKNDGTIQKVLDNYID